MNSAGRDRQTEPGGKHKKTARNAKKKHEPSAPCEA
jgi:hypothetical protein